MGNKLKKYLQQKIQEAALYVREKNEKIYALANRTLTRLKTLKEFFISFYRQYLCNKFVRLVMIFPMFLLLLSGFIEEKKISVYGTLSNSSIQIHSLADNVMSITPIPNSGMIPVNNDENINLSAQQKKSNTLWKKNPQLALISFEGMIQENRFNSKQLAIASQNFATTKSSYSQRRKYFTPFARNYAHKYGLDPSMVLAIIHAESIFYPHLVSTKNAHGLMQVVPSTAGAEVHRFFKKQGQPSSKELMHPETNIRYGTAYLYLLRRYHLVGITDPKVKDILTIASYNAGSGAVLRHFSRNRTEAVNKINAMTPDEVLSTILANYRSLETRKYVKKVLTQMGSL